MSDISRRCLVCILPTAAAAVAVAGPAVAAEKKIIATSKIPVGGGVVVSKHQVVVTQPRKGKFKVFSAVCTHQGCLVSSVADKKIGCPCHGSKFAIATGAPVAGPATVALPKRSFVVKNGFIYLI